MTMRDIWKLLDGRSECCDPLERLTEKMLASAAGILNYTGPAIEDYICQNGLVAMHSGTTHIRICAAEPTTFAIAVTSGCLGFKSFGANNTFGSDTSASPT